MSEYFIYNLNEYIKFYKLLKYSYFLILITTLYYNMKYYKMNKISMNLYKKYAFLFFPQITLN